MLNPDEFIIQSDEGGPNGHFCINKISVKFSTFQNNELYMER